ncbi:MAG: hypothetical protein WBQ26_12440 [Gemmatimonadaceae bacterium]
MNGRNRAGQIVVAVGSGVLFAAAAFHVLAGHSIGFPALAASNLNGGLQSAFRVVFLSVGWDWVLLGTIAVVAAFKAGASRRTLVLICGFGILTEAVAGAAVMGVFIGNEMIAAAAILTIIGGYMLGGGNG